MPPISRPLLHRSSIVWQISKRVFLLIAIYTLINLLTIRFAVDGPSMLPTFHSGQFLMLSRLSYVISSPQRADVVVFHYPPDPTQDYIKRIIGLPRETVAIHNQQVYINGVLLSEPYLDQPCHPVKCPDKIWQLEPDEFFLMGDNRNESYDSRFIGPVHKRYILGPVFLRYFPLSDVNWLHH